ncbi:uncharacterized protein CEXT_242321 [Caerostris extrusa]|uniref:Uncharacterized protein n=1 Tax=Caerostris extrusa TaxID=172846 RepID=A0AAV4YBU4_CAEEX|nr:uncharacterized protein CEXT_242321 [Caerostris extrusa]
MYGHRKSHSDPDIVRMMMSENDNDSEEDDSDSEERGEPEGNFCKRSIIAFHAHYDYHDTPRRPLPPIPPEEMPPPPPPPPPDYNRSSDDVRNCRALSKNYEKNRRTVDKWKFSKQPQEISNEKFARKRCKSLDRSEEQRLRESTDNDRCYRNNSLRRANYVPDGGNVRNGSDTKQTGPALKDAIAEAAKKRGERLERGQECRNSSFKLSMKHPRDINAFKDQNRIDSSHTGDTTPKGPERPVAEHSNTQNFIRKAPIYKRTSDNWKEYRNESQPRNHERPKQIEHKPHNESPNELLFHELNRSELNNRQSKWDSIIHEAVPTILPDGPISGSSASEEEMEIDLQLRPTLPRRPVELSRFSPTDVWKSINLTFLNLISRGLT